MYTPIRQRNTRKYTRVFIRVFPCILSYWWVNFPRSVLFWQPHQQLITHSNDQAIVNPKTWHTKMAQFSLIKANKKYSESRLISLGSDIAQPSISSSSLRTAGMSHGVIDHAVSSERRRVIIMSYVIPFPLWQFSLAARPLELHIYIHSQSTRDQPSLGHWVSYKGP